MQGQKAMVKTPYPIFPPPAYSWAHAAQYICEHQPCTLLPPKITQYLQNIPLGKPKDNATRHIVAKEMRQCLQECIKLHNSRCPSQPCTRGLFVTVTFPPCYMILETWMRAGYIMVHLNQVFQKALNDGFCKQRLIFAAMGVEMHPGESQDGIKKTMAEQLVQEHYKTLQEAGLTTEELTQILPEEFKAEMVKCQDHTKVGTLMYRRTERGSLVGAAHMHITILYSAHNILEAECIRALKLPKVYVDVKAMPAGGLDELPQTGLPSGKKWSRSEITAFERKLLKNRGNAIVYTAYTLKEIHNKHTRLFANEIGGIGNTVHIFATKDFLNLAQALYKLKAGVSIFLKAEKLKPYLAVGSNLDSMDFDNPFPPPIDISDSEEEETEEDLQHIYLMHDKYNRSGRWWDQIEVTPPPETTNSLTGKHLEVHACVTEILEVCNKEKVSPQKIVANKFKNANQTVVKNFNKVATVLYQVYKHLREPTDNSPMSTINQEVLVDLIDTLSTQVTSPAQIQDKHHTKNTALATQFVCHISLLLQPRVRRLKQIFLFGTPGCGKSTILNLIKGHNTDVMVLDEMDVKTVQQFTPSQLNGILEGYLDTQVSKQHQVNNPPLT